MLQHHCEVNKEIEAERLETEKVVTETGLETNCTALSFLQDI